MSAQDDSKPFRFMDLPSELRLIIYNRLPRQIKHTEVRYVGAAAWPLQDESVDSTVILITRHLPVAILRTSRQIHDEAFDIVTALVQTFVTESHPRAIGREDHAEALDVLGSLIIKEREALLVSWLSHYHALKFNTDATSDWSTLPCERRHSATPRPCLPSMGNQTTARHCSLPWSDYTSENARYQDLGCQNRYSILREAGERDGHAAYAAFLEHRP